MFPTYEAIICIYSMYMTNTKHNSAYCVSAKIFEPASISKKTKWEKITRNCDKTVSVM